jgi:hypothetical protein
MATFSAEQVEQRYLRQMGEALGTVYYRLYGQCVWLHMKWREYALLFTEGEDTIDLLNKSAPGFFHVVQETLFRDVLLHMCRLTDPPTTGRSARANLTLLMLPALVSDDLRTTLNRSIEDVKRKTEFARDWRNRRIGHTDLLLALNQSTHPLPPADHRVVTSAVAAISQALNTVEGHYSEGGPVGYEVASTLGGADSLLSILKRGLLAIRGASA